jgi:hypothetical protein
MPDLPSNIKRRPVDALFGESATPTVPTYVVEPPQPVTTVSPPTPEPFVPSPSVPSAASQPAVDVNPPAAPNVSSPLATPEPFAPPALVVTPAAPIPSAPPMPPSDEEGKYFAYLPDTIRQLYEDVGAQLSDSPTVAEYCMTLLLKAREAYHNRDYASAEFYVETVDAKLKRSAKSMQWSRSPIVWLLWAWQFAMLLLGGVLIAMTYIPNLTLFGLPIAPEFIVLMRAVGWAGIGGVIGAVHNLPWFVQFREYDPAYNMNYFARPVQGLLLGAVLFLLSQAGILAGNVVLPGTSAPGEVPIGPVFLYVIAALAGFKQEYVYEFLDNLLKMIFRIPKLPNKLQTPAPPKDRGS